MIVESHNPLSLDEQVCFALSVASRAVISCYRDVLAPLGLTHPQYLVMLALWERAPMSVREIADALQLDSPTLSPLLKRLETAGLITRTRRASDERQLAIELTEQGGALRTQAEKIPPAVVRTLGVELADLEELHRVLTGVNRAASAAIAAGSITLEP